MEEPETMDATISFEKQMTSEQKVVEGSSLVSMEEELANYGHVEEGKDDNLHEEINPEMHPGIEVNVITKTRIYATENRRVKERKSII